MENQENKPNILGGVVVILFCLVALGFTIYGYFKDVICTETPTEIVTDSINYEIDSVVIEPDSLIFDSIQ